MEWVKAIAALAFVVGFLVWRITRVIGVVGEAKRGSIRTGTTTGATIFRNTSPVAFRKAVTARLVKEIGVLVLFVGMPLFWFILIAIYAHRN